MLARVRVVRAAAPRPDLPAARQQVQSGAGRVLGDLRRQFAVKQRRGVAEPGGDRGEHPVPLLVGEPPHPDPDLVRLRLTALHLGPRLARRQGQFADRAAARVVPAPRQPVRVQPCPLLKRLHPRGTPPGAAEFRAPRHDAARRLTSSVSSLSDSSAIQRSPEPITASARSRFFSSRAAILSSRVPSAISRCTCTGRSCPIR